MQHHTPSQSRKLLACLMVTALALPAQAFAMTADCQANPADPSCPSSANNPMVAALKGQLQPTTQVPTYDPATGAVNGQTAMPLYQLSDAQAAGLPASCNPVVWTQLMQQHQQQVAQATAAAIAMNSRFTPALNNKCITNASTQPRQTTLQQIESTLQRTAEKAICSLNWSSIFGFNFDISLGICQNGKLFNANADINGNSQFNINGQNPLSSTSGCVTPGSINNNTMQNALKLVPQMTGGTNGNGSGAGSISVSSVPVPTAGSSGGGITIFNSGGSFGGNSSSSGSPIIGSLNSTSSTTTSNAPQTPVVPQTPTPQPTTPPTSQVPPPGTSPQSTPNLSKSWNPFQ